MLCNYNHLPVYSLARIEEPLPSLFFIRLPGGKWYTKLILIFPQLWRIVSCVELWFSMIVSVFLKDFNGWSCASVFHFKYLSWLTQCRERLTRVFCQTLWKVIKRRTKEKKFFRVGLYFNKIHLGYWWQIGQKLGCK